MNTTLPDSSRLSRMKRLLAEASTPQQKYDEVVHLLSGMLGLPYGWIHLRDDHREWFHARVAWADGPWPAAAAPFEALLNGDGRPVIVEDTRVDDRLAAHPLVVGPPHLRLCVVMPLSTHGRRVGTFCAYDIEPRRMPAQELAQTQALANSVIEMLMPLR